MNTPSKEALNAAKYLHQQWCLPKTRSVYELTASVIDSEVASPLRQLAEQAEVRVKELESEKAGITDALNRTAHSEKILHARVKELEESNANLVKSLAAYGKYAYAEDRDIDALRAANAELAGALREVLDAPDSTVSGHLYNRMEQVLASHAAGEPEAQK